MAHMSTPPVFTRSWMETESEFGVGCSDRAHGVSDVDWVTQI